MDIKQSSIESKNMYEDKLKIIEVFSKEDIKFNKKMINRASNISNKRIKHINRHDVVEGILTEFRKKWGINIDGGD